MTREGGTSHSGRRGRGTIGLMTGRQRVRGFTRVGSLGVGDLGLPKPQSRRLLLEQAWIRVAGEPLARRAVPVAIRRGVLEISIDDPAWAKQLIPLLPRLVGRLARNAPDLGVRKFRVTAAGASALAATIPEIESPPDQRDAADPPCHVGSAEPAEPASIEALAGRFAEVARLYLERQNRPSS